jgi:endonuclease/exonuclease/phosphatase (EEP) superfamily protein YafD
VVEYDRNALIAIANAGTPFVYLPAYGALAFGVATRRRALTATAAAVVVAHAQWTAPELRRRRPDDLPSGRRLRIVSSNVEYSSRDSTGLGRELASFEPDVLVLQELSPEHLRMIKSAGAFDPFPYSYVDARPGSFGGGIWSRFPLYDGETWLAARIPLVRATIDVEGTPVRVFDVHLKAPTRPRWVPVWKAQLAALATEVAARGGPVIMAGDFNATYGHAPFRRLLAAGLREAHIEAGRGLATTWRAHGPVLPPLFRLDHVLVSPQFEVAAVRQGRGPGTDHRPVVADLVLKTP